MRKMFLSITGPSCAGKSTLLESMLSSYPETFVLLRSDATRDIRPGEVDGYEYDFIDEFTFNSRSAEGRYINENYFGGHKYGIRSDVLEECLGEGKTPVRILTPSGVSQFEEICRGMRLNLFRVYVHESTEVLMQRWLKRVRESDGTTDEYLAGRILKTMMEESSWREEGEYDFYFDPRYALHEEMVYALSRIAQGSITPGTARRIMPRQDLVNY